MKSAFQKSYFCPFFSPCLVRLDHPLAAAAVVTWPKWPPPPNSSWNFTRRSAAEPPLSPPPPPTLDRRPPAAADGEAGAAAPEAAEAVQCCRHRRQRILCELAASIAAAFPPVSPATAVSRKSRNWRNFCPNFSVYFSANLSVNFFRGIILYLY